MVGQPYNADIKLNRACQIRHPSMPGQVKIIRRGHHPRQVCPHHARQAGAQPGPEEHHDGNHLPPRQGRLSLQPPHHTHREQDDYKVEKRVDDPRDEQVLRLVDACVRRAEADGPVVGYGPALDEEHHEEGDEGAGDDDNEPPDGVAEADRVGGHAVEEGEHGEFGKGGCEVEEREGRKADWGHRALVLSSALPFILLS